MKRKTELKEKENHRNQSKQPEQHPFQANHKICEIDEKGAVKNHL